MMMIYQVGKKRHEDLPGDNKMMMMMMIYQVRSVKDDDLPGTEPCGRRFPAIPVLADPEKILGFFF